MNWLDLVLLLILVWFAVAGTTAGVLRESVTLLAALLAVLLAGLLHDELAADILVTVDNPRTARIAAFLIIFIAVLGAGQIAAVLLKGVAMALALGPLDRIGGLIAGVLKGIVIVEAVLFLFARYHVTSMVDAMDGSLVTPFFLRGLPFVLTFLPGEFRAAVERFPAALDG